MVGDDWWAMLRLDSVGGEYPCPLFQVLKYQIHPILLLLHFFYVDPTTLRELSVECWSSSEEENREDTLNHK
jgi:hypothetical protein